LSGDGSGYPTAHAPAARPACVCQTHAAAVGSRSGTISPPPVTWAMLRADRRLSGHSRRGSPDRFDHRRREPMISSTFERALPDDAVASAIMLWQQARRLAAGA